MPWVAAVDRQYARRIAEYLAHILSLTAKLPAVIASAYRYAAIATGFPSCARRSGYRKASCDWVHRKGPECLQAFRVFLRF
jgi:hypothetical protein